MPKPRTKRLERKRQTNDDGAPSKRRRIDGPNPNSVPVNDHFFIDTTSGAAPKRTTTTITSATATDPNDGPDREFFGFLTDEEQEYFRSADELLELDQFADPDERAVFVANVFREAQGKELKMACSQGCSRLVERLIGMARRKEARRLFGAFAGHFLTLVQHRFASHCVEALFVKAAPMVMAGGEDGDGDEAENGKGDGADQGAAEDKASMEDLFLLTLDEFDGHIDYLVTDSFASHTLRVLLIVLSGRPLEDAAVKWLLRSKKKMVAAPTEERKEANQPKESKNSKDAKDTKDTKDQLRPVPASFEAAVQKIIADATATLDNTSARVLARHPVGNPTLQLLLQLDLANKGNLVDKILPDALKSFADSASPAAEFISTMVFDPIGSRLVEVLVSNCPGKLFKGLYGSLIGPNLQTYTKSEVASYTVVRALSRLSKEDLSKAVRQLVPMMETLVAKGRWNVVKTLFERCGVRRADEELPGLTDALVAACGEPENLVARVCQLTSAKHQQKQRRRVKKGASRDDGHTGDDDNGGDDNDNDGDNDDQENDNAGRRRPEGKATKSQSHGAGVVSAMLAVAGPPCEAAQTSLLALSPQQLTELATGSMATVTVLTAALASPHRASTNPRDPTPQFHPTFVSALEPLLADLASSQFGHNLVNAVAAAPSTGAAKVVAFHVKERIAQALASSERDLKAGWMGRSVWRTWRLDTWTRKRADWRRYVKDELEPAPEPQPEREPHGAKAYPSRAKSARTQSASTSKAGEPKMQKPTTRPHRGPPKPMGLAGGQGGPPRAGGRIDRGVKGRATGGS